MKSISTNLANIAEWIVLVLFEIISLFTFITSFFYIFPANSGNFHLANMVANGLALFCTIAVMFFIKKVKPISVSGLFKYSDYIFLLLVCIAIVIWGFKYVNQAKLLPESDQYACLFLAEKFVECDYSTIIPKDSYLSLWPFQLSYIFTLEKCMRLFNTTSPFFFQKLNVLYLVLIIISIFGIVKVFTKRKITSILVVILVALYTPLTFQITEVYGDFPGLALLLFSVFMLCLLDKGIYLKGLIPFIFLGSTVLACLYKGNIKIYIVALICYSLLLILKRSRKLLVLIILFTSICSLTAPHMAQKYYERIAQNECGKGVPAVSYIAMGLQFNGEGSLPGGWNGYHSNLYMETDYNYEETSRISKESIKDSFKSFIDTPSLGCKFLFEKTLSQWGNQTHAVWWDVNILWDTSRNDAAYWAQFTHYELFNKLCFPEDMHDSVLSFMAFLSGALIIIAKKREKVYGPFVLAEITYIGGFLFSIIWEGQTRAVLYWIILMIPFSCVLLFDAHNNDIKLS